jgi:hypothetical protein
VAATSKETIAPCSRIHFFIAFSSQSRGLRLRFPDRD